MWHKIIESKAYTIILLALVFLIGLAGTYLFLTIKKAPEIKIPIQEPQEILKSVKVSGSFNAVLLGSGGDGHSGGNLTDSIIIVSVDPKNKKATLISIPRDLWVPGNYKINESVLNVGLENFKGVLQNVTGLKIDKYVAVDFSETVKLINTLGGITVNNPKDYDDYFYPTKGLENETCEKSEAEILQLHSKYSGFELEKQFDCRYEYLHFDKGAINLDGATTLKFSRSRHGDSDFGRSARQFVILKGIFDKILKSNNLEKIDDIFITITKIVRTDLTLGQAKELLNLFGNPSEYQIQEVQLTDGNVLTSSKSNDGQYILVPKTGINNFTEVHKYLVE